MLSNGVRSASFVLIKKSLKSKTRGELQNYNGGCRFERIAIDILRPLPISSPGNKYILIVTDYFMRYGLKVFLSQISN